MVYGTYRTSKSACPSNWGTFQNILKDPMIIRYGWKKKIQFKETVEVGSASCLMLQKDGHILKFPWMKGGEGSKWCRREQDKHAASPHHAGSHCVPHPALPSPLSLMLSQEESSLDRNRNFLLVLRECYGTRASVFACFSQIWPMSRYLWTHFSEHGPDLFAVDGWEAAPEVCYLRDFCQVPPKGLWHPSFLPKHTRCLLSLMCPPAFTN